MKKLLLLCFTLCSLLAFAQLPMLKTFTYKTGIFNDGGSEIVAFDQTSGRLFSTNGSLNSIDIIDASNLKKISNRKRVDLSIYVSAINSVAANNGLIAVAGESGNAQARGKVIFLDTNGIYLAQVQVGFMPDMLTFFAGGGKIMVANEGEPSDDYLSDPPGSVSIITIPGNISTISTSNVIEIGFTKLDTTAYDPAIRIFGNNGQQLPSQDLEPEYCAINSANTKAYVVCQENNAVAIIDLTTNTLDTVVGLGFKDLNTIGLDASNVAKNINIRTYERLLGMYQPDAITAFAANGVEYWASANEGDARDYSAYSEEARVSSLIIDPFKYNSTAPFYEDTLAGRLLVTNSLGDNDGDGLYDSLYSFGARSFSVWDEFGALVWDSGDEFEQNLKLLHAANFNSNNNDNNSYKSRSDDKGCEPEAITTGIVDGTLYAFIALERMGGIMVYDMSNPTAPAFVQYELNRDFTKPANDADAGDLGPEGLLFIPSSASPNGVPLLVVSAEVSGTVTVYQLGNKIGLEEFENKTIGVYPNPANGIFNLNNPTNYEVYDVAGKLITTGKNLNTIDLSSEKTGTYLVKDDKGNAVRLLKK